MTPSDPLKPHDTRTRCPCHVRSASATWLGHFAQELPRPRAKARSIRQSSRSTMDVCQIPLADQSANPYSNPFTYGKIAQLVEQRTENPCVPGSIPGLATTSQGLLGGLDRPSMPEMNIEPIIAKRRLHDPDRRAEYWGAQSQAARLEAVERIRQTLMEHNDPQPPFPRVHRITRKTRD